MYGTSAGEVGFVYIHTPVLATVHCVFHFFVLPIVVVPIRVAGQVVLELLQGTPFFASRRKAYDLTLNCVVPVWKITLTINY